MSTFLLFGSGEFTEDACAVRSILFLGQILEDMKLGTSEVECYELLQLYLNAYMIFEDNGRGDVLLQLRILKRFHRVPLIVKDTVLLNSSSILINPASTGKA